MARPDLKQQGGRTLTRRRLIVAGAAAGLSFRFIKARAEAPVSFGLTPVFLDSDVQLLAQLQAYLSERIGRPVNLVKRRTYQEITALLLSEQLDAAWICGFPLVQYLDRLALVAVPLYRGQPLYQSYLIVGADRPFASFENLRGTVHAFSDPDSNSGFLVTRHLLTTMKERPESFFSRFFFTYGHRNVVRAVASGLADAGSVDGYVWDIMREIEPGLTSATRVIRKSELLGFPPVACNIRHRDSEAVRAVRQALVAMPESDAGRALLATLRLDGFIPGEIGLFDGIARMYQEVRAQA
jgi:phosphonate transport system substrate-binding protein